MFSLKHICWKLCVLSALVTRSWNNIGLIFYFFFIWCLCQLFQKTFLFMFEKKRKQQVSFRNRSTDIFFDLTWLSSHLQSSHPTSEFKTCALIQISSRRYFKELKFNTEIEVIKLSCDTNLQTEMARRWGILQLSAFEFLYICIFVAIQTSFKSLAMWKKIKIMAHGCWIWFCGRQAEHTSAVVMIPISELQVFCFQCTPPHFI